MSLKFSTIAAAILIIALAALISVDTAAILPLHTIMLQPYMAVAAIPAIVNDPDDVWLDFNDLVEQRILKSRQQLKQWQDDPRINFPKGRLFGPNSRRWHKGREINPWLESRPTERAAFEETKETAA